MNITLIKLILAKLNLNEMRFLPFSSKFQYTERCNNNNNKSIIVLILTSISVFRCNFIDTHSHRLKCI